MNFLVSLLKIGTYLQWIAMGTIIAVGAGIVLRGLQLRNRVLAGLGLAVGLSPVLVPMALNRSSESGREERRAAVAAIPREALAGAYPRQMVFRGELAWPDVARLMVLTDLDQVLVQNSNGTIWYSRPDHSDRCRTAARAAGRSGDPLEPHLRQTQGRLSRSERWKAERIDLIAQMDNRLIAGQILKRCGPTERHAFKLSATYLLARTDGSVTHRAQDRRAIPQAIQIDLIESGREHLVYYDEMPVADAKFSALSLPLDSPKYSCSAGFDDAQVIANVLDAAREPSRNDALMARGGARDTCVQSRAPV